MCLTAPWVAERASAAGKENKATLESGEDLDCLGCTAMTTTKPSRVAMSAARIGWPNRPSTGSFDQVKLPVTEPDFANPTLRTRRRLLDRVPQ